MLNKISLTRQTAEEAVVRNERIKLLKKLLTLQNTEKKCRLRVKPLKKRPDSYRGVRDETRNF